MTLGGGNERSAQTDESNFVVSILDGKAEDEYLLIPQGESREHDGTEAGWQVCGRCVCRLRYRYSAYPNCLRLSVTIHTFASLLLSLTPCLPPLAPLPSQLPTPFPVSSPWHPFLSPTLPATLICEQGGYRRCQPNKRRRVSETSIITFIKLAGIIGARRR